jgi:hypothetical protein
MEARSRPSADGVRFYGCAANHRRGRTVCGNASTVPMEVADSAVLSAMERTLLNSHVLEKAVARAVERLMSPPRDAVIDIDHQLRVLEQELDRLTHAIATGGEAESLAVAIRNRELRRRELLDQRRNAFRRDVDAPTLRLELERRPGEWRSLLLGQIPRAQNLLKQLIVGRLEMSPHKERYYTFRRTGTVLPIVAAAVPQSVASPVPVSWNRLHEWLRHIEAVRQLA